MTSFENSKDFEKVVALLLSKNGWEVKMPPANTKGYDIEATRGNEIVAVQAICRVNKHAYLFVLINNYSSPK